MSGPGNVDKGGLQQSWCATEGQTPGHDGDDKHDPDVAHLASLPSIAACSPQDDRWSRQSFEASSAIGVKVAEPGRTGVGIVEPQPSVVAVVDAVPMQMETHKATVTGLPALLIILVVIALIVIGIIAVIRFIKSKATR